MGKTKHTARPTSRPHAEVGVPLTIRISADLRRRLKVHCVSANESVTAFVTRVVEAAIKTAS